MIDDALVVDATVHGFNFSQDNLKAPFMEEVVRMLHGFTVDVLQPIGDARYRLSYAEFQGLYRLQPRLLEEVLFAESAVDIAVYHGVPMYGLFGDGSSPVWIGEAIAKSYPHRMFVYADVSPFLPDPLGHIDRMTRQDHVIGIKFYPADMVEGRIAPVRMDDEQQVMPLIARARDNGIKVVAIHKAVPLGPLPRDVFAPDDLAHVFAAFPDMQFEIVHGGFAFAEETALLLSRYDNVWINLESNPCFAVNMADKFATMIEPLLATGRVDRLCFATGATGVHPRPFVEAFWRDFQMPKGSPQLSTDDKRGILGLNYARLHGWDVAALTAACRDDRFGLESKTFTPPWRLVHEERLRAGQS